MKRILITVFLGILTCQPLILADTLEQQQEEFRKILSLRFKYENLKSIRDNYEKELNVLEAQYERNKQIEDFQKRQRPDVIRMAVYTTAFNFISSEEWNKNITNYADELTVTKIPRRSSTDVVFHFPTLSAKIKSQFDTYKIEIPTLKVVSVLLSSGKLVPIDQIISSKIDEQSITVETDNASILKINLIMDYEIPAEDNIKTTLTEMNPNSHGIMLLPTFENTALLQLDQDTADNIIQIDAMDDKGNILAARGSEKIVNINDLSTQAIRIDMIKSFLKAMDDKEIKNQKDAVNFLVDNSESYLLSANNTTRHLSKAFSGKIAQVIIYTTGTPIKKQYEFSIY